MQYIAKTMAGLEPVLQNELQALGAENIIILKRAVSFEGDLALLYRANYELRTALRILQPIAQFEVRDEHDLYKRVKSINWSDYMGHQNTLAIDAVVSSQYFNHTNYVALKSKDAIVDQFREKFGRRPDVDVNNPDVRINIHIGKTTCSVSLDSSGDSLHKRKYRVMSTLAPINEVLAAGMVQLSEWTFDRNFIDPMCGSGTIIIEAAMLAYNIPPQVLRKEFAFMKWPDFDRNLWRNIKSDARKNQRDFAYKIIGFDKSVEALKACRENLREINLQEQVKVAEADFKTATPLPEKGILMMNPPYDERLEEDDIKALYGEIGTRMKHFYAGYEAWIISANFDALKNVGLRPSKKIQLFNGPLPCKFQKYEMYEGSKKGKKSDEVKL